MPDVHLYCDYWAAVLSMRGIVRDAVLRRRLIDLDVFRSCLDRPETRLPGLGYSLLVLLLGPVLIPYRMLQRIASRLHVPLVGEEQASRLLQPFRLQLARGRPGRVDVAWQGDSVGRDLIDPERPDVVFSVVYPAYKVLVAALLAIGVSLFVHWVERQAYLSPSFKNVLLLLNFPLLAGLLYLIFRDWLTALLAPLPVFVVLWIFSWMGPVRELPYGSLPATMAALAVAYFLVDIFMLPRGMAPTLYLYNNNPESEYFPYETKHAPSWLEGRYYWVWRFVAHTPAELHKFWERDWERVEVWVRADGEQAGLAEWAVVDHHFRELWIPYEKLVSASRAAGHRTLLRELHEGEEVAASWIVEVDTNFVGHAPELRGIFMLRLGQGWRRARWRQLARSLRTVIKTDKPSDCRNLVRELRMTGPDFIEDIPEHLRWYALRELSAIPWRYWRYPRGANAAARRFLYGQGTTEAVSACEPEMQFKAFAHGLRRRACDEPAAADVAARAPVP